MSPGYFGRTNPKATLLIELKPGPVRPSFVFGEARNCAHWLKKQTGPATVPDRIKNSTKHFESAV